VKHPFATLKGRRGRVRRCTAFKSPVALNNSTANDSLRSCGDLSLTPKTAEAFLTIRWKSSGTSLFFVYNVVKNGA
jgi:hypothetical protein